VRGSGIRWPNMGTANARRAPSKFKKGSLGTSEEPLLQRNSGCTPKWIVAFTLLYDKNMQLRI